MLLVKISLLVLNVSIFLMSIYFLRSRKEHVACRCTPCVVKSTHYLFSLEPVKRSGRHDCVFTHVRSPWYTRGACDAAPIFASRTRSDTKPPGITSATSHDAGKYTYGNIHTIDSIENHPVCRWRVANSRRDHKFALLSSYFPTRLLSPRVAFPLEFTFQPCLTVLVSVSVTVRDNLRVIQGSNDTTAPWRSPGSRSKSTRRIR